MKNLFLSVITLLSFTISSSAQDLKGAVTAKAEKAKSDVKAVAVSKTEKVKSEAKSVVTAKVEKIATDNKKNEVETKLKKDGTPDKRFKEAKNTAVKLKKDGTPDKRFKENKK